MGLYKQIEPLSMLNVLSVLLNVLRRFVALPVERAIDPCHFLLLLADLAPKLTPLFYEPFPVIRPNWPLPAHNATALNPVRPSSVRQKHRHSNRHSVSQAPGSVGRVWGLNGLLAS